MEHFKKRLRRFAESLGGQVEYGHDGSITVQLPQGRVTFASTTHSQMTCTVLRANAETSLRPFEVDKTYCFDIVDRLAEDHLAESLTNYRPRPLLTLDDYINEENGAGPLASLLDELKTNPNLERKDLSGNLILVEYTQDLLILRHDFLGAATNVIEIGAAAKWREQK